MKGWMTMAVWRVTMCDDVKLDDNGRVDSDNERCGDNRLVVSEY